MPTTSHVEKHFTTVAAVRDVVIGMSDGLTVPFALAAGLTGAVAAAATGIIVTAGLAEIAAGSIAMGLGGYLAAKTDSEHYESEKLREYREIEEIPDQEELEIVKVFREYGLSDEQLQPVVKVIRSNNDRWVDFMMRFELGLEKPDPARAARSAGTIAASYIVGRIDPAGALHAHSQRIGCAMGLGWCHAYCSVCVSARSRDTSRASSRGKPDRRRCWWADSPQQWRFGLAKLIS